MQEENKRSSDYPIHPMILNRWSARSMTGESFSDHELMTLFEAARWAPSSYNNQPWRFLYVKRDTPQWEKLFGLLVPFNQSWCIKAAVLVLIYSKKTFDQSGKPSKTHSFDTGAAWQNLCLQGFLNGLIVHGMEGFDYNAAQKLIPEGFSIEAMCAIGKQAPKERLSEELQKKEAPSTRKPLSEIVSVLK